MQHFHSIIFQDLNSSTGIPSPPVALFIVMFSKAHLSSHSRMSSSRWVFTPSWLSGSWRYFIGPYHFCPYQAHLCMKCSLGISNFLEEISSLSHICCFPLFLCIDHWGRLSYLFSAFRGLYLFFSPLLYTFILFTDNCKASPDSHFAFLHFFSMGMVLIPVSCSMSQTSIHSSSGTLSIRSSPLNLLLTSTV